MDKITCGGDRGDMAIEEHIDHQKREKLQKAVSLMVDTYGAEGDLTALTDILKAYKEASWAVFD